MKIYKGERILSGGGRGTTMVTVDGVPLAHRVRHSPTGFEWGYGGSGPADLARSILWEHLGEEPPLMLYQKFKWDFVAKWPPEGWEVTEKEIDEWMTSLLDEILDDTNE